MKRISLIILIIAHSLTSTAQWNDSGTNLTTTDNVGIGTSSPGEKLQIGSAFTFHDGGHEVLGFGCRGSGSTDLNPNGYASEIRLDPVNGNFRFAVSSSLTSYPQTRLTIRHNGHVGVGTTNPGALLHVERSGGALLRLSNDQNNYLYSGIDALGAYIEQVSNTSGKSKIRLQARNANQGTYSQFFINGENNSFNLINGNVGIGTTSPDAKLHVDGKVLLGNQPSPRWSNSLSAYVLESSHFYGHLNTGNIYLGENGNDIFVRGNLKIGTEDLGSHKLAVEGSIGAREIKVEANGWSDFVFEKDYRLPTLEEVEKHIEENGHLPEIPSEAEVTENGINLGEMNAKLLQKIEELTLYMIDVNKRATELETENEELKRKVGNLEGK